VRSGKSKKRRTSADGFGFILYFVGFLIQVKKKAKPNVICSRVTVVAFVPNKKTKIRCHHPPGPNWKPPPVKKKMDIVPTGHLNQKMLVL